MLIYAGLAQLVEQRIRNAWVECSSHLTGTICKQNQLPFDREPPEFYFGGFLYIKKEMRTASLFFVTRKPPARLVVPESLKLYIIKFPL